ncbi:hypothetical protein GCM10011504_58090 [Siccirubricoccus deserti]|nr:hypothetical protein GCM10011504_58090 [Siccirubricoccus deserti]
MRTACSAWPRGTQGHDPIARTVASHLQGRRCRQEVSGRASQREREHDRARRDAIDRERASRIPQARFAEPRRDRRAVQIDGMSAADVTALLRACLKLLELPERAQV